MAKQFTPEEVSVLQQSFREGLNASEIAAVLNCWLEDIQAWLQQGDNLKQVKLWELQPRIDSKKTIAQSVKTKEDTAKWYLSKKDPEFADKPQTTLVQVNMYTEEQQKRIAERILGKEALDIPVSSELHSET